ncbi:DsrE/DsrF/DrsH-like family protein [uncultured Sphingosinicella sp.]|uniref:DsrE/DsrF/DrsH-like family protein n=1 Tax=uncultured Sphingosinicella sp. TaxID=478748 RepID=UPI0030D77965
MKQQGLALIFAEANHARLHGGLSLALAAAALGRPVRLFFQGEAVCALQAERHWAGDKSYKAGGLPRLSDLLDQAIGLGLPMMACESGIHLCGLSAPNLIPGIETGGMVAFLADAREDELLFV